MGAQCSGCCVVLGRQTCGCFGIGDPIKRVLITGRKGSGKTSLMYRLHSGVEFNAEKEPTIGHNYEVISFTPTKSYEFVDAGGSDVQQMLLDIYIQSVNFDYVIYVIDMSQYLSASEEEKRAGYFRQDRENLIAILTDQYKNREKRRYAAEVAVYINYHVQKNVEEELKSLDDENKQKEIKRKVALQKQMLRALLADELGLHEDTGSVISIPPQNFVDSIHYNPRKHKAPCLLKFLGISEKDKWDPYCFSSWINYFG
ncbi:hypothetical protein AAMO2058_000445500 [Amorphochlora amoebiformis]